MMEQLWQTLLVARFESKMLFGSWAFRIILFLCFSMSCIQAFGTLGLLYMMSADIYFGPMFGFTNTILMTLARVGGLMNYMVVFFANDFGSRDKRIGISDVVGSRPLTEGQYVIGRILGLVIPLAMVMLFVLTVLVVVLGLLDVSIASFSEYAPFFLYFNMISLLFCIGFTALLSTWLKSRTLTSLIAITIILASGGLARLSTIFDYTGFTLGLNHSQLIGYGPIGGLALHRTAYLFLALLMVAITIYAYPRAEAARRSRLTKAGLGFTAIGAALFVVLLIGSTLRADAQKNTWALALQEVSGNQAASVSHYDMDMRLRPGRGALRGKVGATLVNRSDSEADSFIFMLNPGLDLDVLTVDGDPAATFNRRGPVVELTLSTPLDPGASVASHWEYAGKINPRAAWLSGPMIGQNWMQELQGLDMYMEGLSGWMGRRYSFFLPESHWYPVPNSDFGHTYPDKQPANFATAQIRLQMPGDWMGLTQGKLSHEEQSDGETIQVYEISTPVPQFSLCAGEYERVTYDLDGVELTFLYAPRHGANVELFAEATDEIKREISESLENIENRIGLAYPYRTLSVVEVPSLCRAYSDSWDGRNLLVQPGVMLLPEINFFPTHFARSIIRAQEGTNTDATYAQIKTELLRRYFANLYGGDLELNLLPNYWQYQVGATGSAYPVMGPAFTAALADTALGRHQRHSSHALAIMGQPNNIYHDDDGGEFNVLNPLLPQILTGGLERDLLEIPLDGMRPEDQEEKFVPLVNEKTAGFLDTLAMAMGEDNWESFLPMALASARFKPFTLKDFEREAEAHSGEELSWVFEQFVTEAVMPGYVIGHADAYEIDDGQRNRLFQTVVRVANLEEGKGFVKLVFETHDENDAENVEQDVYLDSYEVKEVRTVLSFQPHAVRLESPYSRNVQDPVQTLYIPKEARSVPGEDSERTVDALSTEIAVIVDDVDEGFSTVKLGGEERTRVADVAKDEEDVEYPRFRGLSAPRRWQEQSADSAYGNYERTRKIKRAGDGSEQAIWAAELPHAGTYEVFFFVGRASRGKYLIGVDYGESTRDIVLELQGAKGGWNSLGKYRFEEGAEARVILSDGSPGGSKGSRIYADAVKWVYEESSDAVE